MAKPDQIRDDRLRGMIEKAYQHMRQGKGADAVRALVDAYLYLIELKPQMLTEKVPMRRGEMLAVLRWPQLGANLKPASVRAGKPEIEITRERFATSEAMTYYEYVIESALRFDA